jgi:uncharacterized glyoxalase superfamily protein PhnB
MGRSPRDNRDPKATHKTKSAVRLANNRSMPENAVVPVLNYPDVRAAVQWLCNAFGFHERLRVSDHRAQLNTAGEGIVARQGTPPLSSIGHSTHSVMVRIANLKAHHQRAVSSGARVVSPPTIYPYGEQQYTAMDPWGHVWTFSETVADSDPEAWGGILLEDCVSARCPTPGGGADLQEKSRLMTMVEILR